MTSVVINNEGAKCKFTDVLYWAVYTREDAEGIIEDKFGDVPDESTMNEIVSLVKRKVNFSDSVDYEGFKCCVYDACNDVGYKG